MFYITVLILVATIVGYIFNFLPLAYITVAVMAIIGMPVIARLEARK